MELSHTDHDPTTTTRRPILDDSDHREAVEDLIEQLQRGHDTGDADTYDSMFSDDIVWGSPKGQVLKGFDRLNAIHRTQLTGQPAQPTSTFALAQSTMPAPGVVVAQIARRARNGGFSEMAMYVLIRRDGRWWVAAGQNTPITDVLPDANPQPFS